MQLNVKFFASLAEQTGTRQMTLRGTHLSNVLEVWNQATAEKPLPQNTLCAINCVHASFKDPVHDGDEVAFFPPVTGG
jgi:molybdopterin synthase sulfur carrier subunit